MWVIKIDWSPWNCVLWLISVSISLFFCFAWFKREISHQSLMNLLFFSWENFNDDWNDDDLFSVEMCVKELKYNLAISFTFLEKKKSKQESQKTKKRADKKFWLMKWFTKRQITWRELNMLIVACLPMHIQLWLCRRFTHTYTLIRSIRWTGKMIDTIHSMNIIIHSICVWVCVYSLSLSPLGGCLVATVMDKDNSVFICCCCFLLV